MNRTWIVLALWAVSPALGQVGSTALITRFDKEPSAAVIQAMQDEVNSLMASSGARFVWRSLPLTDPQVWSDLAVLTFLGKCEVAPFAIKAHFDERLGWTHVSDGIVQPFSDIDCDAIEIYIQPQLFSLPPEMRDKMYGRAIGRVVAHELLHVFARTTHHGAHGVDQAALSRADLLADHLDLERAESAMVHPRISPPKPGAGSPPSGKSTYMSHGCSACHGDKGEGTKRGPILKVAGRILNSVVLASMLTKHQDKMVKRARGLKMTVSAVDEAELPELARYLNWFDQ